VLRRTTTRSMGSRAVPAIRRLAGSFGALTERSPWTLRRRRATGGQEAPAHPPNAKGSSDLPNMGRLVVLGLPQKADRSQSRGEVSNEGGIIRFSRGSSERTKAGAG
jgi:hypothetical protein